MRSIVPALLVSALCACSSIDPPPLYVEIDYQVRCITCEPRSPDDPRRGVKLIDGERGYVVDCHTSVVDGDDVLSFSLSYDDPDDSSARHSIEVQRVEYTGDDPGSKCEVVVRERNNRYVGGCTADDPTAETPCQVRLGVEDGILRGTLLCAEIPNEGIATSTRHLVRSESGDAATPDESPAEFEIHGCTGL